MWDGKAYDVFQKDYQFRAGSYLVQKLENFCSLLNKSILDLGCGSGDLTSLIAEKSKQPVIAVDADESMLSVLREKYPSSSIETIFADIPNWLAIQEKNFDIIFSNATFHWFGSHDSMLSILKTCYKNLSSNGLLAVRFSLKENGLEIKQYLAEKISEFFGDSDFPFITQSKLDYSEFCSQLNHCGFDLLYKEELKFIPFKDPDKGFQFMIQSQPIRGYFTKQRFIEFEQYLKNCWQDQKAEMKSHHAVVIASKSMGS
jgi:ubiquinone/menaquinone biosynthesis C-methylase UbiE